MSEHREAIRTLDDLKDYVHQTLCEKENLLTDQFSMTEVLLIRRGRPCGLQFSIHGPRSVRLGAIWATDYNQIFFYDARGSRFMTVKLRQRLLPPEKIEAA